jgi:DNA-directed RNA polymerase specialized sigma24 family protein
MSHSGSISVWIESAKAGCEVAAIRLWNRYRTMLLTLARKKLGVADKSVIDEEDIVVEAFYTFLRRCRQGRYPDLRDRDDLGRLLVAITIHRTKNRVRDIMRQKRVGGGPLNSSEPMVAYNFQAFDLLPNSDPSPDVLAALTDTFQKFLSLFVDGEVRSIVLYKLEGRSNLEIAAAIGRSVPTVERRLRLIRERWLEELSNEE